MTTRRTFLAGIAGIAGAAVTGTVTSPARASTTLRLPPGARVLLVGDSYTVGVGATPYTQGWAYHIGALGWRLTRDGRAGSGYVNPGSSAIYDTRLYRHPADAFDLVVLQGGSNDERHDRMTIAGSINMTFRTVLRRFPDALVLVLGPASPYGSMSTDRATINDCLVRATASYSMPFVNPIAESWFVPGDGARYANLADGHPNNAGHALIAKRFVQDVQTLTSPSRTTSSA